LKPLIHDYCVNLFSLELQVLDEAMLEKIRTNVTNEMNDILLRPLSTEDVKKAPFSIGDYMAPRPDGIHAIFYKKKLGRVRTGDYTRGSQCSQYWNYTGWME
jgi:hypothetical protein